ncbi:MAG: hypothetical protein MUE30_13875 [Spirosomaceae bacterium]|jgi:tetratricopeptide (TPR) repeat protein|nr:hypothetical protein [Spirosomataceae bacterium]
MGFLDAIIVIPLLIGYFLLKYYTTDHQTVVEKDRARFKEGIALYEARKYAEAMHYFDQKMKEYPKSALVYAYRGKCQLADDNLHTALYNFNQALAFELNLPDVLLEKGKIHFTLGEFEEAFLAFDKAAWFTRNKDADIVQWRDRARSKVIR